MTVFYCVASYVIGSMVTGTVIYLGWKLNEGETYDEEEGKEIFRKKEM